MARPVSQEGSFFKKVRFLKKVPCIFFGGDVWCIAQKRIYILPRLLSIAFTTTELKAAYIPSIVVAIRSGGATSTEIEHVHAVGVGRRTSDCPVGRLTPGSLARLTLRHVSTVAESAGATRPFTLHLRRLLHSIDKLVHHHLNR